jgi:hypothetical protein
VKGGPLTTAEVEEEIAGVLEHLENLTEEYARVCHAAAEAEADYRLRYFKALLRIKANGVATDDGPRKATDKEADALATVDAADELRAHKITGAYAESTKQALYTHRARLDALRTVAANARALT